MPFRLYSSINSPAARIDSVFHNKFRNTDSQSESIKLIASIFDTIPPTIGVNIGHRHLYKEKTMRLHNFMLANGSLSMELQKSVEAVKGYQQANLQLPFLLVTFCLLSAADYLLTKTLLQNSGGTVYESNPLANFILQNYSWIGLAWYKAAFVCLIIVIGLYIARQRPRAAHGLLTFACLLTGGVVAYSLSLVLVCA